MKNDDRTFLGKPMRAISLAYHSHPITFKQFVAEVKDGLDGYYENLKSHKFGQEDSYTEVWMESFLAWFELEQDTDV